MTEPSPTLDTEPQTETRRARHLSWWVAVLVATLLSALAMATATAPIGLFHDDGIYAVTAKSLAEGTGYRVISLPGSPVQTKYPVIYPFLLSLIWRVASPFPSNVLWLKALGAVSLGATVILAAALLRRWSRCRSPLWVLAFTLIVGLNPLLFSTADLTLSDGVFGALLVGALLVHVERTPVRSLALTCGAALLSGIAMQTRQIGVALVAAGLVWAWRRGARHLFAYLCISLALVAGDAVLRRSGHALSPNLLFDYYTGYETPLFARLIGNPRSLWHVFAGNVAYTFDTADAYLLFGAVPGTLWIYLALTAAGVPETLRRGGIYLATLLVVYLGPVLAYPFVPSRYLLPLVPLALLCLCNGVLAVSTVVARWRPLGRASSRLAMAPIVLLLLTSLAWGNWYRQAPQSTLRLWTGFRATYGWSGFTESFAWVRDHTHDTDLIATAYDPSYYLYTGRRGIRPWLHRPDTYFYPRHAAAPDVGRAPVILASLDALGVNYLAIDPLYGFAERDAARRLFAELVLLYGPRAVLAFESSDHEHRIYRIAPRT